MNRKSYKEQIHVSGKFGTVTVRRDDEPDYGTSPVEAVVSFDGVVDFRSDGVLGVVSLGDEAKDEFVDEIDGRVRDYTVHTFEEDE